MLAACGASAPPAIEHSASPPLRYGVIGDSYSNGEGVGAHRSWPEQLARRLTRDGLPIAVVANPSVTGWTTAQALADELPEFERSRPDVATLQIGVNDWVQGVSASAFRARFRELLDRVVRTVRSPSRVVVVTIPDFSVTATGAGYTGGRDASAGLRAFNAIARAESQARHVAVVDVFELSRGMSEPALTAPDGLHPSATELALWTARIAPVARRRFASARRQPAT